MHAQAFAVYEVDRCSNLLGLDFIDPLIYVTDLCCLIFKTTFIFSSRWERSSAEEDLHKMGKLSPGPYDLQDWWPLHRPPRWTYAYPTAGGPLWGTTGQQSLHLSIILYIHLCIHLCMHPYIIHASILCIHPSIHASISNKPSINQMLGCCDNHYNIIYYICFTSHSLV